MCINHRKMMIISVIEWFSPAARDREREKDQRRGPDKSRSSAASPVIFSHKSFRTGRETKRQRWWKIHHRWADKSCINVMDIDWMSGFHVLQRAATSRRLQIETRSTEEQRAEQSYDCQVKIKTDLSKYLATGTWSVWCGLLHVGSKDLCGAFTHSEAPFFKKKYKNRAFLRLG